MNTTVPHWLVALAVVAITTIEIYALNRGVNGYGLAGAIALLAALAGVKAAEIIGRK